jgi:hypothetical protein
MIIHGTSVPEKDPEGNDKEIEYVLEDKDFLLITAINTLANEIKKLRLSK